MVSRKIIFLGRRSDASFDFRTKSGVDEGESSRETCTTRLFDFSFSRALFHSTIREKKKIAKNNGRTHPFEANKKKVKALVLKEKKEDKKR